MFVHGSALGLYGDEEKVIHITFAITATGTMRTGGVLFMQNNYPAHHLLPSLLAFEKHPSGSPPCAI